MQRFFPSTLLGTGLAGAAWTWPGSVDKGAAKVEDAQANPAVLSRLSDVGIELADGADADLTPTMHLGADLSSLLALNPRHRRQAEPDPLAVRATGKTELEQASEVFNQRLVEVRNWLALEDTVSKLRARGLRVADVELQLKFNAGVGLRKLGTQAARGDELLHLVPTAHDLFSISIRDADMALMARRVTTTTTSTTTTTTAAAATTTPGAPATTQATPVASTTAAIQTKAAMAAAPAPVVDLVRREKSLKMLEKFQENYFRALPQIYNRKLHGLWEFMQGQIQFLEASHMAATFPVATKITLSGSSPHYVGTYPTEGLGELLLREGFIRGIPAVVARDDDSPTVKICTNGYTWQKTTIYTDDVVEAEKMRMWKTILTAGGTVYRLVLQNTWF